MILSRDAIIFGLGDLNRPRCKLSFRGEGAQMASPLRGPSWP